MLETANLPSIPLADEAALAQTALETLQVAIALIDKDGVLSLANGPCQRILSRADSLVLREGRLTCLRNDDSLSLQRALERAFTGLHGNTTIAVSHSGAHRGYSVSFLKLSGQASRTHCMTVIVDPQAAELASDTWRSLDDLSERELLLAQQILSGRRRH